MAFSEVLVLTVYWNIITSKPFIKKSFGVKSDDILADIIVLEVLLDNPSRDSINFVREIKSAPSFDGMDTARLLELPVSHFLEQVVKEKPKQLIVVIAKPTAPSSVTAQADAPTALDKLTEKAKPDYTYFTSKFNVEAVRNFQHGYHTAKNNLPRYLLRRETRFLKRSCSQGDVLKISL